MSRPDPLPLPAERQTPHTRLARRVDEAVAERGRAAVAQVAARLLRGTATPQDVTSGAARQILGDDGELAPAAAGALTLGLVWDRRAGEALVAALDDPDPEVRAAALLVLAGHAETLRADAAVDRPLVDRLRRAVGDPDPQVREAAAAALGALARTEDLESALPVLNALVTDVDPELAAAGELALAQLAERLGRPDLVADPRG
ncbi:HEAT repeat domain-containing protein [Micrococcus sp.]|uniref:HEAT repeat domain-containing protein n=1 Tax=Micrococcus sp. TaxID=1271 RepID=UPI002A91268B|nr:HEAT repeat domain-containing protein [Micrococcus sp.]MDY6055025.1 HEAT repeat domain-containing protein [Micrococcus sp.]